jgi:hypothetical protein
MEPGGERNSTQGRAEKKPSRETKVKTVCKMKTVRQEEGA